MCIKNGFLLPVVLLVLDSVVADPLAAQTFKVLHNFSGSDAANPNGALVLAGDTLYGTTKAGGSSGFGTVFAINTDGSGFRTLHTFFGLSDGAYPLAGLIFSGETLYGTTTQNGDFGNGTVFSINTNGTGFVTLYAFSSGSDGSEPAGNLLLQGSVLYGTADLGGDYGKGVVYALNTNGTGFTTLYSFSGATDGSLPFCNLQLSGNKTLIGTTTRGGNADEGTVFAINTDGSGFTNLYSFSARSDLAPYTNSDGAHPFCGLTLSEGNLYGATAFGGSAGQGTLFKLNTDGTGFTTLYSFTPTSNGTNSDGGEPGILPGEGLTLSGSTLYGTAPVGGSSGNGTAFAINIDGSGFTLLHTFSGGSDGALPNNGLVLSGGTLYGTAFQTSAAGGNGTIFSISLLASQPPQLTITSAGANVILSWPIGFTLQSTTNLASPVWTTNLPAPVVINGQNTVTNPVSVSQQFFRLSQ